MVEVELHRAEYSLQGNVVFTLVPFLPPINLLTVYLLTALYLPTATPGFIAFLPQGRRAGQMGKWAESREQRADSTKSRAGLPNCVEGKFG